MYARLVAALIIIASLAAGGWKLYVEGRNAGRAQVQQAWDKDIQKRTEQALADEQAGRAKEQQLVAAKHKAEEAYVNEKRKAAGAAANAQSELDRLRDALAERGRSPDPGPSTQPRADGGARLEQQLLGHCAGALTELAAEADRLETIIVGLQGYVKNVCLSPGTQLGK